MKHLYLLALCIAYNVPTHARITQQEVHRYLMANYYEFAKKPQRAGAWYKQIDEKESLYVYTGFIPFLQSIGHHQEIVRLIPSLDTTFAHNQEMQLIFANAFDRIGNTEEAHKRLIQLNTQFSTNQEIAIRAAEAYM